MLPPPVALMLNAAVPPAEGTPVVSVTVPEFVTVIAPLAAAWLLVIASPNPSTVMPAPTVAEVTAPPALKL
jgi:hypothetical protein